jgi:uncharacterized protein YsxB (DUF464 family)
MILIDRGERMINIGGHANYDEPGRDIVCAAVSMLTQTLIQSLEELTEEKIKYVMIPGTVHIQFGDLSERARLLVDSFFVGVSMLAEEYPDNVNVNILKPEPCKH